MSDRSSKPGTRPFSLRLSPEERARLDRDAAGMSVGSYVRQCLFGPDAAPPRTRGKFPVKDHQALSRLLALLGGSRLSSNLNQLAKSAHLGALPVTSEVEAELLEACEEVAEMRDLLLKALGLSEGRP